MTPYLSEIRLMAFTFAPAGWALCNGQILPINQNQALFSLLGTTYGGNGVSTFALPNLQGRVPLHFGNSGGATYGLGAAGGEAAHTLLAAELPAHTHPLNAKAATADLDEAGVVPGPSVVLAQPETSGANKIAANAYGTVAANAPMAAGTVGNTGGGQGHPNQQPYLVLNYCIALTGVFPSQG